MTGSHWPDSYGRIVEEGSSPRIRRIQCIDISIVQIQQIDTITL